VTAILEGGEGVYPPGAVLFFPGLEGHPDNYGVIRFTVPASKDGAYPTVFKSRGIFEWADFARLRLSRA